MEELTKTEERIMQIFWERKSAFVKDIIDELPDDPKPPYSTISSVIRILEKKGYLGFRAYGKTYEYFAVISKTEYARHSVKKLITNYFDGSATSLLSFMAKEEELTDDTLKELQHFINKQ